jgi:hypothetical protein
MPGAGVRFRPFPWPGEGASRTWQVRPALDGFKAGSRVLKSRVRGNPSRPRVAHCEFLSGRAGLDMVR